MNNDQEKDYDEARERNDWTYVCRSERLTHNNQKRIMMVKKGWAMIGRV